MLLRKITGDILEAYLRLSCGPPFVKHYFDIGKYVTVVYIALFILLWKKALDFFRNFFFFVLLFEFFRYLQ